MRKSLLAGAYSSVFCVVAVTAYFTAWAVVESWPVSAQGFLFALMNIFALSFIPAALFGFILGFVGEWVLEIVRATSALRTVVAAFIGALLGGVPPAIPRLFPPEGHGEILPIIPCVVIGSVCAASWQVIRWGRAISAEAR